MSTVYEGKETEEGFLKIERRDVFVQPYTPSGSGDEDEKDSEPYGAQEESYTPFYDEYETFVMVEMSDVADAMAAGATGATQNEEKVIMPVEVDSMAKGSTEPTETAGMVQMSDEDETSDEDEMPNDDEMPDEAAAVPSKPTKTGKIKKPAKSSAQSSESSGIWDSSVRASRSLFNSLCSYVFKTGEDSTQSATSSPSAQSSHSRARSSLPPRTSSERKPRSVSTHASHPPISRTSIIDEGSTHQQEGFHQEMERRPEVSESTNLSPESVPSTSSGGTIAFSKSHPNVHFDCTRYRPLAIGEHRRKVKESSRKSPKKKYSLKLPGPKEPESIAPHSPPSRLSAGEDEFLKTVFFGNSGPRPVRVFHSEKEQTEALSPKLRLESTVSTTPHSAPTRLSTGEDEFFNKAYLGRSEDKTSSTDGNKCPEDKSMISETRPPVAQDAITQTRQVSDASTQVPELVDVETPVPDFGDLNARASQSESIITQDLLQTEDITKTLQVEDISTQAPPPVLDVRAEFQSEETFATPQLTEAFHELKKDISDIFHKLKDELHDSCSNDDCSSDD